MNDIGIAIDLMKKKSYFFEIMKIMVMTLIIINGIIEKNSYIFSSLLPAAAGPILHL
jgi:hypothetical protein